MRAAELWCVVRQVGGPVSMMTLGEALERNLNREADHAAACYLVLEVAASLEACAEAKRELMRRAAERGEEGGGVAEGGAA